MKHRQALDVGHAQRVNLRELYEEIRDNVDIKIESKLQWILDTETHFNAPTPPVVNPLSAPTRRITVEAPIEILGEILSAARPLGFFYLNLFLCLKHMTPMKENTSDVAATELNWQCRRSRSVTLPAGPQSQPLST